MILDWHVNQCGFYLLPIHSIESLVGRYREIMSRFVACCLSLSRCPPPSLSLYLALSLSAPSLSIARARSLPPLPPYSFHLQTLHAFRFHQGGSSIFLVSLVALRCLMGTGDVPGQIRQPSQRHVQLGCDRGETTTEGEGKNEGGVPKTLTQVVLSSCPSPPVQGSPRRRKRRRSRRR